MIKQRKKINFLMYGLLFVSLFTSRRDWNHINPAGEILRFDFIRFGGFINIEYLFVFLFILVLFYRKFIKKDDSGLWGDSNYLKTIFFLYFVPVNLLIYLTVLLYDIHVLGTGWKAFMTLLTYFVVTFYVQDIFYRDKDIKKLSGILTVVEIMILGRCIYSIAKYHLGYGHFVGTLGFVRMGQENDFADFFILMLIIALTRLLFVKNESGWLRFLHIVAVAASSYISVMSARRYVWGELLISWGIILFFHYKFNRTEVNQKILAACLIVIIILSSILVIGPDKLTENFYVGRFITVLSLIDTRFENELGTENLHRSEIKEGWENVKQHWLLGVTQMGGELLEREETKYQTFTFVHNGYIAVWLTHGLLGFILYMALYFSSLRLGYIMFFNFKNASGLILLTFMICQMVKNIIWPTVIENMNTTIVYIFIISFVLQTKHLLLLEKRNETEKIGNLSPV